MTISNLLINQFFDTFVFFLGYKQSRAWIEDSILLLSLTI